MELIESDTREGGNTIPTPTYKDMNPLHVLEEQPS